MTDHYDWRRKRNGSRNRASLIRKRKRLERCEELLLQGVHRKASLATILGVSSNTITQYTNEIFRKWREASPHDMETKRAAGINRLFFLYFHALQGWERSRQNEEIVTTQMKPQQCKACEGTGFRLTPDGEETKEWCKACEGDGEQLSEVITRKVRGQAGDASFLEQARKLLQDIHRLQGLEESRNLIELQGSVAHVHAAAEEVDKFRQLNTETLLKLRAARDQILQDAEVVEGKVIPKEENNG